MLTTITLISSRRRLLKRVRLCEGGLPGQWVYLGVSVRKMRKVAQWLGAGHQRLSIAGMLQGAGASLRAAFIDYIGRLGAERDSATWWFSSLSEKNPPTSKAFLHVCYLSVAAELCRRHESGGRLLLVVEDPCVRRAIAGHLRERGAAFNEVAESPLHHAVAVIGDWSEMLVRRVYGVGRHLVRMVTARVLGFSDGIVNAPVAGKAQAWALLHNWVDTRSFDEHGLYRDVYFGTLREELQKRGLAVAVVSTVLYRSPFRRLLARLRDSGMPVLVPEAALTPGILWRWSRSLPFRPPQRRSWPRCAGFDVSDILTEAEREDWINQRAADVRLLSDIVRRWSGSFSVQAFIYTYEGQSWERGYCRALREHFPQARLIGYQHSTVSPMWLSHFISKAEWGKVPFPDRVVTNGPHPYDLLRKNGVPEQVLACGGALRYGSALGREAPEPARAPSGRSPLRVLVTPSIVMTQAAELLLAALRAFQEPDAFKVTIKFHPCFPSARVLAEAGVDSLPAHVTIATEPVPMLLRDADVLVYTDSTTAVEALAQGVPIVHFASNYEIDTDPLATFEGVRVSVDTAKALGAAARAVVNADAGACAARVRRWRAAVDELLPLPNEKTIDLFMPENVR